MSIVSFPSLIFLIIQSLLAIGFTFPSLVYLYRNSHFQRVKSRNFSWIALFCVVMTGIVLFTTVSWFLKDYTRIPCTKYQSIVFMLSGLYIGLAICRVIHLYGSVLLMKDIVAWNNELEVNGIDQNEIFIPRSTAARFSRMSTRKILISTFILAVIIGGPASFSLLASGSSATLGAPECEELVLEHMNVFLPQTVAVSFAMLYVLYKLLKAEDSIGMKTEIYALSIIGFISNVIASFVDYDANDFLYAIVLFQSYSLPVIVVLLPLSIGVRRDKKHVGWKNSQYEFENVTSRSVADPGNERQVMFHDVLADKARNIAFTEFCISEYSVENILFWNQVEKYEAEYETSSPETVKILAMFIRDKFLDMESIMSVNISYEQRIVALRACEQISFAGERPPKDLFAETKDEIFGLMLADTFERFVKSTKL